MLLKFSKIQLKLGQWLGIKALKLCLDYGQFDIENDVFKFATTGTDGVCIKSLSMDSNVILIGPNRKKPNVWFDGNSHMCTDDFAYTPELIHFDQNMMKPSSYSGQALIQNNVVSSSECDP